MSSSSSDTPATTTPPIMQAAGALAATIASPSVPVLVEDLLTAHKILSEVKASLSGHSASVVNIFKALFNL